MKKMLAALMVVTGLLPLPALAHPHIFIDATAAIRFNDAGEMVSIRNSWTFDQVYSAWAAQGLDSDNDGELSADELQPVADDNMLGLGEYQYYTFAGEGEVNLAFTQGSNASITYAGGLQTLAFDVALDKPYAIGKALEIAINDPEYYVAITFANASRVSLVNAPANCSYRLEDAAPMPDELQDQLTALGPDVTKLPRELEQLLRGVQGAIVIECLGGSATGKPAEPIVAAVPSTALDAATQLGEALPTLLTSGNSPLGGPPPEPGLVLPKTGLLGWVSQLQANFYQSMVAALDALRSDWTAFWLLGGLSFLYGIFHAAGPGHGKVVISSYVLANEAQMRRGVGLSFLSAMLQSLVAIGFVLVAALALRMTSLAMNDAAHWIGVLSYAMIAMLGLWLIARKIFRLGHAHGHAAAHSAQAHHGHDHHHHHEQGRDHTHIVLPAHTGGGWREQLGVVLAVGLRPCSGALIVLAFALSQGLLVAGILSVLLMGLGTAITTGTLAALAVGAKGLAQKLAGADNPATARVVWWVELLAALAVFGFGAILLASSL